MKHEPASQPKPQIAHRTPLLNGTVARNERLDTAWQEYTERFVEAFQPTFCLHIETGIPVRDEELVRRVKIFLNSRGRFEKQHYAGVLWRDAQPNSYERKVHGHIIGRTEKFVPELRTLEAHWREFVRGENWNATIRKCGDTTQEILQAISQHQSDAKYFAVAQRWEQPRSQVGLFQQTQENRMLRYTQSRHEWEDVIVGCPKISRAKGCRRGDCHWHADKEYYLRSV